MTRYIDLTGKEYKSELGTVKVLERSEKKSERAIWVCKCFCGKVFEARSEPLRKGYIVSCGCKKRPRRKKEVAQPQEKLIERRETHTNASITKIATLARQKGMSYGQYVASMAAGQ